MHNSIQDYFPMKRESRPGQAKALDFIERMVAQGCTDIIIEAPTGCGKTAVGAACCYWAADWPPQVLDTGGFAKAGGYYLVTQKELQKQIKADVATNFKIRDFSCLWSAASYPCDGGRDTMFTPSVDEGMNPRISCQMGMRSKQPKCRGRKNKTCPYMIERIRFDSAQFSLTNYPFFMTERIFVGNLAKRNIMVLDECHTVEKQLLKFGEVEISDKMLREWDIRGIGVPEFDDMDTFINWLEDKYLPRIQSQLETYIEMAKAEGDDVDSSTTQRITALENQEHKIKACISGARVSPKNWVYWFDQTERDGNMAYCKPLDASPYMDILRSGSLVRVYMSAFPGHKETFCRSLGLDPDEVAWLRLGSGFPKENRPVIMGLVGSMSRKNQVATMPSLKRVVDKILAKHKDEKGIIHCHSYALGNEIRNHIMAGPQGFRVIYPEKAEDRELAVARHRNPNSGPTILISPSVTEGFDFKGDESRWQIIAKVPYPYLGDRQVAAKKDQSQGWYDLQTVMTIVQSAGRICRSEDDWGVTYILDEDFKTLYEKRRDMFPGWFKEAIVWP
ncbi:MAG: helicase C-terminal domain-containing protein [Azonexus sp.]